VTPNEIQMLIAGVAIGSQLTSLMHGWLNMRAARRQQTEAEAARKRASGDLFLSSLGLYRLQNRSRV